LFSVHSSETDKNLSVQQSTVRRYLYESIVHKLSLTLLKVDGLSTTIEQIQLCKFC